MIADDPHPAGDELQFDRVVSNAPASAQNAAQRAVVCTACSQPINREYYHLNGKVTCESCRNVIEVAVATPEGALPVVRAAGLGIIAAIAGAAIYYGVIKLAHLEIGLIAIAIGYMVGWAVRKGAGGGGRRYQVLAVALTYWSVGLAYAPFFLQDSSMPLPSQFFYIFALPIMVITSGGSGILTAIIIAIGLRQAWQMTAAPSLTIAGPYRVGSGPSATNA
jgi:hypothetical protein